MRDQTFHDDQTLSKVYRGLEAAGLTSTQAHDAIAEMLNQGILFREHLMDDEHEREATAQSDMVNHPPHYTGHPSGVECITIVEHMNFCIGSAIKYLWRAGSKGDRLEDLKKAHWYVGREIQRLTVAAMDADARR